MATETATARRGRDVEAQSAERKHRAYKFMPQERAQRLYVTGGTSLWTYVQTLP